MTPVACFEVAVLTSVRLLTRVHSQVSRQAALGAGLVSAVLAHMDTHLTCSRPERKLGCDEEEPSVTVDTRRRSIGELTDTQSFAASTRSNANRSLMSVHGTEHHIKPSAVACTVVPAL